MYTQFNNTTPNSYQPTLSHTQKSLKTLEVVPTEQIDIYIKLDTCG